MWASAALVNRGAVRCGTQLIVNRTPDLALTGQPLGLDAVAAGCDAVLSDLETAQRLNPNSARSEFWIGYAHLARGNLAPAAAAFDRSAGLEPKNSVAWLFAGIAYYRWGQNEMALARWERIHDSTRALTVLADRLAQQDQCVEAEAYYRLALQQPPPGLDEAHLGLADCLYEQERFEEAAVEYQAALQLGLENAAAANRLGNLLVRLSRPQEAIPYLAQALEWHLYPFYMIDLAKGHEANGDLTRAEYWLAETERQFPNTAAGFWELGNYYLRHEQYREAIAHYRRAVTVDPGCPYYCYADLGRAYLATGCPYEAAAAFAESLRRDPTNLVVAGWLENAQEMNAGTAQGCQ